jgi:DNA-binding MarR family transcriptional regulator
MPNLPRPRRAGGHARVTTASLEAMADDVLLAPVAAARNRIQNPRELSDRVAFGKALWRELVIGFAAQLGEVRLGFTQLAALYVLADGGTTTIVDLADTLNRSPSATSRLVDGLERRRLLERRAEIDDRRMRSVWLTERGRALLAVIDRSRADQFLAVVRPLPANERAIVAMGVAALATRAGSRRGRLLKQRPE